VKQIFQIIGNVSINPLAGVDDHFSFEFVRIDLCDLGIGYGFALSAKDLFTVYVSDVDSRA
jgi:hypothetical protein